MKFARLALAVSFCLLAAMPARATGPLIVFFDTGSWVLDDRSRTTLQFVVQQIRRFGPLRVRLWASTDTVGTAADNLRLSRRRGEAVRRELVRLGIARDTILIEATGETRLLVETADNVPKRNNRLVGLDFLPPVEAAQNPSPRT